jgi:hypothetical protein
MVFCMVRPIGRPESSVIQFRKRVPVSAVDQVVQRFPEWKNVSPAATPAPAVPDLTFADLFEKWRREVQPAAITTWRCCLRAFEAHVGHDDPAKVSKA